MTDAVACEYCGEEFSEGSTDLPFHWYCQHLAELDDEQFRAPRWVDRRTVHRGGKLLSSFSQNSDSMAQFPTVKYQSQYHIMSTSYTSPKIA